MGLACRQAGAGAVDLEDLLLGEPQARKGLAQKGFVPALGKEAVRPAAHLDHGEAAGRAEQDEVRRKAVQVRADVDLPVLGQGAREKGQACLLLGHQVCPLESGRKADASLHGKTPPVALMPF